MSSLSASGLSGIRAARCCSSNAASIELQLRSLLGDLLTETLVAQTTEQFDQEIAAVPVLLRPPLGTGGGEFQRLINLDAAPESEFQRLLRKPNAFKLVRQTRGSPLALGGIVLLGSAALSTLIRQLATLETLTAVIQLIDRIDYGDCVRCIKRSLWTQRRKQARVRASIRQRGAELSKAKPGPKKKTER